MDTVKVLIWGFGAMGKGIAEMILSKKGFEIVGVCDNHPKLVGFKFTDFINTEYFKNHTVISKDIDEILVSKRIDIAIIATDSFTRNSYDKIVKLVENGVNVISTAEEMSFPEAHEPDLAKMIDNIAKENKVSVLGTGINPGFVMDLLAIALTGTMRDVNKITCKRVNSLSPFGPTVMEEQGVGISLESFQNKIENHDLAGHVGFKESVYMISKALGVKLTEFKQQMEPIITNVDRVSLYGSAKKGHLAGINMTAQGLINKEVFIDMKHPQQIEPNAENIDTGDYITIEGIPRINMSISPEIDGGIGTIAMCVNMIPHVINARPGLKTMLDLPIPRAILGDVRHMIDR